ncbi:hypothetical protein BOTBODRAFT_190794 [Botryobasidium botryosum FD-172 SS1]|uniref:MYND-type domain-containing protein n=1 Tax=Botryobasidium botryosum (strain FD-172 SS1) TaxID=930990 RepID=A0A067MEM2_BOTB1|nr:hypothetical protein BOTBODRAFT_190794 [Botryobasidium botryosum FD-172 SS1]
MAHPLYWPGKYFFYPIGNTSAVCLTRDLAPEETANILLLGCGDPRNVLYTIFSEPRDIANRTLDFTCCDIEPGVLARNVLLFTMVADNQPYDTVVWNTFFHIYLDVESHALLVKQCNKLIGFSDSLKRWDASPYGSFIKMSTEYTLAELRRHWSLYANMQDLPPDRTKAIYDAFNKQSKSSIEEHGLLYNPARSSGPVMMKAMMITPEQFQAYWRNGVTSSDSREIAAATLLNPTFAYSLAGEGCTVHYGTTPLSSFHLAGVFGNAKSAVSAADAVRGAQAEFSDWCSAFHTSIASTSPDAPIVRLFLGDALVACHALRAFATTGALSMNIPVAPWKSQLIQLNRDEYVSRGAPTTFSAIDTSNLDDYLGLLNVLVASAPLLSTSARSSVLYTESLVAMEEDATKDFVERLYADITTIGLLFDLCPVDYLSGFNARSNTHELLTYDVFKKANFTSFHQVTTWKSPSSGDAVPSQGDRLRQPLVFDPHQLGTLLYDIYHELFAKDGVGYLTRDSNLLRNASKSSIIHYTRESFVLFLKFIKERLAIPDGRWSEVVERVLNLSLEDTSLILDRNNYQDLCGQLHRYGVHTVHYYRQVPRKIGLTASWDTVPSLARVIITVPREKLTVLERERIGTPPLHCDIRSSQVHNMFAAVHVAFGQVVSMGTKSHPRVIMREDPKGWEGTSPLVASFIVPTIILTEFEPMENLIVALSVRSTPAVVGALVKKLGSTLSVFATKLTDTSHVYLLPEQPLPSKKTQIPSLVTPAGLLTQIGKPEAVVVDLDEECELVASLTCRISIENKTVKEEFGAGATPTIAQVSPCIMRITVGNHVQDVMYPFPVIGSQYKLRNARKSSYIEVVVPVSGSFKADGMKLNPFPVTSTENSLAPWNVHRLNLSRLPILDVEGKDLKLWLNAHIGATMSSRELSLRKKHKTDALMFIKDTLHAIFVQSSGIQTGTPYRLFTLEDDTTKNSDTIFFISDLRYDLHSHTVVCDGYVLPLAHDILPEMLDMLPKLLGPDGGMMKVKVLEGEMRSWKQLLPAFVERCRTWQHGGSCEYRSQGKIPLTEAMEEDPLCSCGRGKDTEGMSKVPLWSLFAPYVTRMALSPLFAVSYLERVGRNPDAYKCSVCRKRGNPKIMTCGGCKRVRYCSKACQRKDWKSHSAKCKP